MKNISSFTNHDVRQKPHGLTLAALFVITSALAGCSFGNLKPSSTLADPANLIAAKTMEGVAVSPGNWPREQWWASFGDAQLNQLVEESLSDSPTLRIAAARVKQAEAIQGVAESKLLPQVGGNVTSTRQHFSEHGTTAPPIAGTWKYVNQATLNVGYELDFWGKNRAAVEAALGRSHAMEIDRYATQLMLASAIVQAYIELQQSNEQISIERRILKKQQGVLELTLRRFAASLDSQINIKQAQASIPATKARIAALGEAMELSRNRLAALLGKGPDRGRSITAPNLKPSAAISLPSTLPAQLLGRRPDVVAQRWRVEAAMRDIDVAKARFYPNINLMAFVGLQSLGFDQFAQGSSRLLGAGPAISLPIFEGGRLRANLASQNAAYDIAVESYNQTLTDALRDIADQLASIHWLKDRLEQQLQAVETADDAAQLVQRRYAAGLTNYIQVMVTQTEALSQQRQLAQLQSRGLSLEANLSRALGGGYMPTTSNMANHQ